MRVKSIGSAVSDGPTRPAGDLIWIWQGHRTMAAPGLHSERLEGCVQTGTACQEHAQNGTGCSALQAAQNRQHLLRQHENNHELLL